MISKRKSASDLKLGLDAPPEPNRSQLLPIARLPSCSGRLSTLPCFWILLLDCSPAGGCSFLFVGSIKVESCNLVVQEPPLKFRRIPESH